MLFLNIAQQVLIKLVGAGPEQLAPDLAPRLQSLLGQDPSPAAEPPTAPLHRVRPSVASTAATPEAGAAPQRLLLAGLTVRRGCVELVLSLVSLPPDTERPGVGVEPRGGSSRPSSSADVIGGHLSQPGWWRSLLALLLQQPDQQAAASGPPAGRQPPQFVKAMVQVVSSSGTMRQQQQQLPEPGQPCTAWECASAASGCGLDSAPAPDLPGSCLSHHSNQGWGLAAWPQVIALTPGGQTGPPACCPPCHVPLPLTLHLTHPPPRAAAYSPLAAATADPPTEPTYTAGGALCWAPGSLPWGGGVQVKARCGRGPSCPLHASPRDHAPGQGAGGVAQGHAASQMQVVAMVPSALAAGGGLLLLELWVPAQQSSPPSSCPCHDPAPLLPPGPAPPAHGATPPTSPPPHLSLVLLNQVPVVVLPSSQAWWWWPGAGGGGPQPVPLGVSRAGALAGEAASQERVRAELAALLQQESCTGTTGGPCPAPLPEATALILPDVTAATDPGAVRVDICCSTPDGSGPSALLADLGAWLDFAAQLVDAGQREVAGGAGRPGAAAEAVSAPASQIALPCPDLSTSPDNRPEPEPKVAPEPEPKFEPITQPTQRQFNAHLAALAPAAPSEPPMPLDSYDPFMLRQLKDFRKFFASPNCKTVYNQLQQGLVHKGQLRHPMLMPIFEIHLVKLYAKVARARLGWSGVEAQLFIRMACGYGIDAKRSELRATGLDKKHVANLKEDADKHRRLLGMKKQGSLQITLRCMCAGVLRAPPAAADQPHLLRLAAASSAGTSLEANLEHIPVTLATRDALWELEDMAEVSMERHGRAKQLVVFFGATGIGTRSTDQRRVRVVLVDEHRTTRVCSAVSGQQPCEEELDHKQPTRPAGWKLPAGQVDLRQLRPAWSWKRDQPMRGTMWCPVVAPRKPPQAPHATALQPHIQQPIKQPRLEEEEEEEEDYSGIHRRALREELPPGARPAPTIRLKETTPPTLPPL
ncbi:hypothetical protein QJQ45_025441 [Haematococcus lacustris]|nr:hypothetical protein QJQ45_025441 [Haematococcus lacustris]